MLNIKNVRIDGEDVNVIYIEPRKNLDGDRAWGLADIRHGGIEVIDIESESRQKIILLHEILHYVNYNRFAGNNNLELSEMQTQSIATALFQVFSDNPELVDLFKKEKKND